ncbi:hypothetical protein [Listeria booriae]|uniref:hypothetical protein n=1 Tax=Listeria booriae TaxID=1552123 RepID=UPI001624986D|nr:hypothetical protein [Listeria booriae]MBC1801091.1 hypothetical protein [Listeria booriae]
MREVKVFCRVENFEFAGFVKSDRVFRVMAEYLGDYEGLKICVRKSPLTGEYIVFDAGSGGMITGDLSKSLAIERALLMIQKVPDDMIKKAKKQHNFYGIPAMRIGMNIIPMNTLLGNKRGRKIYERRTGEKFRY